MHFNYEFQKYRADRNLVYGRGMVATSQPLAAQAGRDMLRMGGNAIDAAIAAAAMLTVTEPTSNGFGSDAFALVWAKGKLHGLNASGPAPAGISAEALRAQGHSAMPVHGLTPVTVPGAPAAWAALWRRFGRLPFAQLLRPAAEAIRGGFPVQPTTARYWAEALEKYRTELVGEEFAPWFDLFAPGGRTPAAGELHRSAEQADTLELLGRTECEAFYRGELAEKIDAFSRRHGGYLRKEDLAAFQPQWVEPIRVDYKGYEVCEIPPNGHGITALMALNIYRQLPAGPLEDAATWHRMIESMKLAFVDAKTYVAEPSAMEYTPRQLLSEEYAARRAALIGDTALEPTPGTPPKGGTVYLCTADDEGNMVSYIQSNYQGFGSGIVIPGTGISLHNRGVNFNLTAGHPNCLAGGKRPYHTIIPGFLMKDGEPVGPFGVMGAFMQPQGHFQVITSTVDQGLNPQDALDAPRWQWLGGKRITVEPEVPTHIVRELIARGHQVEVCTDHKIFGRGQIIWRTDSGTLVGGTDSRCDSCIAVV